MPFAATVYVFSLTHEPIPQPAGIFHGLRYYSEFSCFGAKQGQRSAGLLLLCGSQSSQAQVRIVDQSDGLVISLKGMQIDRTKLEMVIDTFGACYQTCETPTCLEVIP